MNILVLLIILFLIYLLLNSSAPTNTRSVKPSGKKAPHKNKVKSKPKKEQTLFSKTRVIPAFRKRYADGEQPISTTQPPKPLNPTSSLQKPEVEEVEEVEEPEEEEEEEEEEDKEPVVIDSSNSSLVNLFENDYDEIPDGVSKEDFYRLVAEYKNRFYKEPKVKVPRSVNFNFKRYMENQERIMKEHNSYGGKCVDRNTIGSITENSHRREINYPASSFVKRAK